MVLFASRNGTFGCPVSFSGGFGAGADLRRRFTKMSVRSSQKTTTTSYRTVKVATPEPATSTVVSSGSVGSVSPVQYTTNGYETVRYLVPMQPAIQQQHSYVLMQQPVIHQPMVQQVVSPVYLQGLQHLSVSSQDSDLLYQQHSAVGVSSMIHSYVLLL